MSVPTAVGKPFVISKSAVMEAYRRVRANKGAPGVDNVSLEEFESDLKGNLYKVWNRMSSTRTVLFETSIGHGLGGMTDVFWQL